MSLIFRTAHGDFEIPVAEPRLTIIEILKANGIPYHSVAMFRYSQATGSKRITGLYEAYADLHQGETIMLCTDRNIDYPALLNKPIEFVREAKAITEYSFDAHDEEDNTISHVELTPEDCMAFVTDKVSLFLKDDVNLDPNAKIVVGVSGGGDSNAILHALLGTGKIKKEQLVPVMILGIPDWDKGRPWAEAICDNLGIKLTVLSSKDINTLLKRKTTSDDWAYDFEKLFPDADLEMIGTHAVRIGLRHIALKEQAQAMITGLNLEDLLAEAMLNLMQGERPLPFPVRTIDEMDLWYPLYQCPKKIIDGCFPKYALENYNDRFPSKMYWRAACYYLAQMVHPTLPGIEYTLLEGFKKMANTDKRKLYFDKKLGFSSTEKLDEETHAIWMKFLSGNTKNG
mgnify:CR=1 FL=1